MSASRIILAVCCVLAAGRAARAAKPESSEQLKDVNILGESRLGLRSDKPDTLPAVDATEALQSAMAQRIAVMTPADKLLANLPILLPPRIASDLIISPWRRHLWSPPVLYLAVKSPAGMEISHWRLVVTDDLGQIFRTIKGKGDLPGHIEWDGLSDSGEPLRVGHAYSCSLSLLDRSGVPSYIASKSVRLSSYVNEQRGSTTIILDTRRLFTPGPRLSPEGNARLQETRDWLRQRRRSLRIEVHEEDAELAQREADLLRKFLEEGLYLKEGSISVRGHGAERARYYRAEITGK